MGRVPLPGGLKRWLVPVWNRVYWSSRRLAEILAGLARGRVGACEVCGRWSVWLHRPAVVPRRLRELWGLSERQAVALACKESNDCLWCGAKLRARRMARTILDLYPVGTPPRNALSLSEWIRSREARGLRVAEINRIDGIHDVLSELPHFACSDFTPGASPGAVVDGVRSESLEALTYAAGSFDLILTSETLEHVPDLARALCELRRVLVPDGRHVFTIPVLPDVARTYARATLQPDGSIVEHATRICHPGGDTGYPVFTEFGADLANLLNEAGFEVEVRYGPVSDDDLAQVYVTSRLDAGDDVAVPSN